MGKLILATVIEVSRNTEDKFMLRPKTKVYFGKQPIRGDVEYEEMKRKKGLLKVDGGNDLTNGVLLSETGV